jgi:hypothetical protein
MGSIKAGAIYFALVFGIGFVLGTARVLVLAPRLGELTATLLELPLILAAAWIICGRLIRRFAVPSDVVARLGMGAFAFLLLMIAELGLSIALGQSLEEYLLAFRSPQAVVGLAGQLLYAAFPLIQLER